MRIKVTLAVIVAFFAVAVGTLLAHPGNGVHNGWPNHGISSPGVPNHYASPHALEHP